MNIQQLRYVVATAERGSMTAAAASLYVAQPALSRAVRSLERELGTALFERRGRGVRPTPAGRTFVDRATRVLDSIDRLRRIGYAADQPPALVIAASPTLQSSMAIPTLVALREEGIAVRTRLLGCNGSSEVAALVAAGTADLGLCDRLKPPGLANLPLGTAEVKVYAAARMGLPERLSPAALARRPPGGADAGHGASGRDRRMVRGAWADPDDRGGERRAHGVARRDVPRLGRVHRVSDGAGADPYGALRVPQFRATDALGVVRRPSRQRHLTRAVASP